MLTRVGQVVEAEVQPLRTTTPQGECAHAVAPQGEGWGNGWEGAVCHGQAQVRGWTRAWTRAWTHAWTRASSVARRRREAQQLRRTCTPHSERCSSSMSGGRSASWIDALLSRTTSASCACCIAPIARSVSVSTGGHLVSTASVAAAFSRCSLKKLSSKFRGSFFFFGCGSAGWICPILVLLVGSMAARVHGAEGGGWAAGGAKARAGAPRELASQ